MPLSNRKNTLITLLAFLLPALIMMLIFVIGSYAPFGKVSILVADMRYQFVDYIGYMKSVFFGNNDLFYTFSKTFGGDMMGFAAYYLFNPFFLILLLFPNDILPVGIVIMMILICGSMGLSFYIMLRGIWGNRFSSLLFSTAYAMMGYNMAYINCIHYFFSVIMLPLVILGLYRMMTDRRPSKLYITAAAAAVISCYYIGYMILIFTAAFFICFMISGNVEYKDMKDRIRNAWTVLYSTLLAVGISAFSLLSVIMSLQGQKKAVLKGLTLSRNFNILEFFSGLYAGSFKGNISDGLPIIYCSVTAVVFVFFYFANRTIAIRKKICCAVLFLFLIAGYLFDALNIAWHGFASPIGFPYRNSFLFSFLMLFIGYNGFIHIKDEFKKSSANILVIIFILYSAYLYLIGSSYVGIRSILITFLTMSALLILVVAINEKNRYIVPALVGLFMLQIADSIYNGCVSVDAYFDDKYAETESLQAYKDYIDQTQALVDHINEQDRSFFRMDKMYRRTHNDPLMFSYNGLSHFSSCETKQVKTFMGRMGFRDNVTWAFYGDSSTGFADCFMGLKYLLSQFDETCKPYKSIYTDENAKRIFLNPYALSLGFGMDDSVKYINMNEKDPFKLQNDIASRFTRTNYQIYHPVKISNVILENATESDHVYTKTDPEKEASVEYVMSITSSNFIYMYFDAPTFQNTTLYINGDEKGNYFSEYDWSIREGGYYNPGEQISIKFMIEDDTLEIDNAYFYYESPHVLKAWYKDAMVTTCNIEKISSSHLKADVDVRNGSKYIVFSIPYEEDWTVKLDGKKVKPVKVMDALMAVKITGGEHNIELRYIPRGLKVGTPISILSLITTFCVVFVHFKKKTQEKK
ncbi:MAG: YfhO family protein [Lachnospiraceae bacterium]|nr:YfhO family protein [Lachnospiraceae bacterium]